MVESYESRINSYTYLAANGDGDRRKRK